MVGACYQFAESGTCSYGDACKFPHLPTMKVTPAGRSKKGSRHQKKKKPSRTVHSSSGYLDSFFAQYPAFDYRRTSSSTGEFYRMCDQFDWDKNDRERREAHDDFKTALVQQFNSLYGTEVDDIVSWRGLCLALEIFPLPEDVETAKQMFRQRFVNLVDLVDVGVTRRSVTQFNNLEELREYTIGNGKYFPKESAYAGGMLKFLLREIQNKYMGHSSRRRRR